MLASFCSASCLWNLWQEPLRGANIEGVTINVCVCVCVCVCVRTDEGTEPSSGSAEEENEWAGVLSALALTHNPLPHPQQKWQGTAPTTHPHVNESSHKHLVLLPTPWLHIWTLEGAIAFVSQSISSFSTRATCSCCLQTMKGQNGERALKNCKRKVWKNE